LKKFCPEYNVSTTHKLAESFEIALFSNPTVPRFPLLHSPWNLSPRLPSEGSGILLKIDGGDGAAKIECTRTSAPSAPRRNCRPIIVLRSLREGFDLADGIKLITVDVDGIW
jgi:hypothetical protein